MKLWKFFIGSIFMSCIFLSCQTTNALMLLSYDEDNNMLLIDHMESARTIKSIELDLQQDTLVIQKIVKKLVPFNGEKSARKAATCIVHLPSNIEFVKLGNQLYKLSEMNKFSPSELMKIGISIIIVSPRKFPYVFE